MGTYCKCAAIGFLLIVNAAGATQYFVNGVSGNDANVGTNSALPKKTIQAAVDAAKSGDTIKLASGVYSAFSSNNKSVTITGSGVGSTYIDGGYTNRCATLGAGTNQVATVLSSVTIRNGYANGTPGAGVRGGTLEKCVIMNCSSEFAVGGSFGGGAYGSKAINCSFIGNSAAYGGGLYGGYADRCHFVGNSAYADGGAVAHSEVRNSLLDGNESGGWGGAASGAACSGGMLVNCTVVNNYAEAGGAVANASLLANCILWNNHAGSGAAASGDATLVSCYEGDDPGFKDASSDDYSLLPLSPCIDAGTNAFVKASEKDIGGSTPRILNRIVDIGCYECGIRWPSPEIVDCDSPQQVVDLLANDTVEATVLKCVGDISHFTGGILAGLPFDEGICLDTGSREVFKRSITSDLDLAQADTNISISGHLSVFEFQTVATSELLSFHYAYASSEFDQGSTFSDPFALMVSVNGGPYENLAMLDNGMPVSVKNLRAGRNKTQNSNGNATASVSSTEYFNYWSHRSANPSPYVWAADLIPDFQGGHPVDGITIEFAAEKAVQIGDTVRIKFAIADTGDTNYDSFVFIKSGSLGFAEIAGAPIADFATDVSTNGFVCNWHEVTGAVSYRLDVSASPDFEDFICEDEMVEGTHFRIDGSFPQDAVYYYRVRAVGGKGTVSDNSNVISVTIPTTVVGAPTITPEGREFSGTLTVCIVNNHPGAVLHYTVDGFNPTVYSSVIQSGGTIVISTNTTVKAIAVYKEVSSPVASQTYTLPEPVMLPGKVLNVKASDGSSVSDVVVTWSVPATGTKPFSYEVSRAKKGTGNWVVVASDTVNCVLHDSGPEAGIDYTYRVRAKNEAGWGAYGEDVGWAGISLEGPADAVVGWNATNLCLKFTSNVSGFDFKIVGDSVLGPDAWPGHGEHAAGGGYCHIAIPENTTLEPKEGSVVATVGIGLDHQKSCTFTYTQNKRPAKPVSIEIVDGADSIEGGGSSQYKAMAHFEDGSVKDVTAESVWSVDLGKYAHFEDDGRLVTHETTDLDGSVVIGVSYTSSDFGGVAVTGSKPVFVTFSTKLLAPVTLSIEGDDGMQVGETKQYRAFVDWNNATRSEVSVDDATVWSATLPYGTVKKGAFSAELTAYGDGKVVELKAEYEYGTNRVSSLKNVTVSGMVSIPVAVDWASMPCATGGTDGKANGWYGQTDVSRDGVDAARSGKIFGAGESWFSAVVTNAGDLSFWWNVSSEPTYDCLQFEIDGNVVARTSGVSNEWRHLKFELPMGVHTLRWTYVKDGKNDVGEDCGWVDGIGWTPLSTPSSMSGTVSVASISASDGTCSDRIEIEWTPFASARWIYEYELSRKPSTGSQWSVVATGNVLRFVDTTALPGVDYTYRVRARNEAGWGSYISDAGWRSFELEVSPSELCVPNVANAGTVAVSANAEWSISANGGAWLSASAANPAKATVSFAANNSLEPRAGSVTVTVGASTTHPKTAEIGVLQAGRPPVYDVGFVAPYEDWRTRMQISTNTTPEGVYAPVSVFAASEPLEISFGWTNRGEVAVSVPSVRFRLYSPLFTEPVAEWTVEGRAGEMLHPGESAWSGAWPFNPCKALKPGDYRLEAELAPDQDDINRVGDLDSDQSDNIAIFRFAVLDAALALGVDAFDAVHGWMNVAASHGNDFAQPPHLAVREGSGGTNLTTVQFGPYVPMNGLNGRTTSSKKALDLVFLVDYSGSQQASIAGLMNNIGEFIDQLFLGDPEADVDPISDLRIKIAGFSDYRSDRNYYEWFHERAFTADRAVLKNDLAYLMSLCNKYGGGGYNGGESSYDALYYICKGWRPNKAVSPTGYADTLSEFRGTNEAARAVILITDEPPHLPLDANGCSGYGMSQLASALVDANISLTIVGDGEYRRYESNKDFEKNRLRHEQFRDAYPDICELIETGGRGTLQKFTGDVDELKWLATTVASKVATEAQVVEPVFSASIRGGGTLRFDWKNDSVAGTNNTFAFECEGVTNIVCGAGSGWTTQTLHLGEGVHFFNWSYGKLGYEGAVSDCGLLSNVVWDPWQTRLDVEPCEAKVEWTGVPISQTNDENTVVFEVKCNSIWKVVDYPTNWVSIVQGSGSGTGVVVVAVHTNMTYDMQRTGTITIRAGEYGLPSDETLGMPEKSVLLVQNPHPYIEDGFARVLSVDVKPRWPWNEWIDIDFRVLTPWKPEERGSRTMKISFKGLNLEGGEVVKAYTYLHGSGKSYCEPKDRSGTSFFVGNEVETGYNYATITTSGIYRVSWNMSSSEKWDNSLWRSGKHFHTPAFAVELGAKPSDIADVTLATSRCVRVDMRQKDGTGGFVMTGVEEIGHPEGKVDPVAYDTADKSIFPSNGWNRLDFVEALSPAYSNNFTQACVLNDVYVEGGVIDSDTTWRADKVHVVRDNVFVSSNAVLTIEDGAVVKFCTSTRIYIHKFKGASGKDLYNLVVKGAYFTTGADIYYGGDTMHTGGTGIVTNWDNGKNRIFSQDSDCVNFGGVMNSNASSSGSYAVGSVTFICPYFIPETGYRDSGIASPYEKVTRFYTREQKWGNLPKPLTEGNEFYGWFVSCTDNYLCDTKGYISKALYEKNAPNRIVTDKNFAPFENFFNKSVYGLVLAKNFFGGLNYCPKGSVSSGVMSVVPAEVMYDGKVHSPSVSVTIGDVAVLTNEYSLSGSGSGYVAAGSYTLSADFTNEFSGVLEGTFTVLKRPIDGGAIMFSNPTNGTMYLPTLKRPDVTVRLPDVYGSSIDDAVATKDCKIAWIEPEDHTWPEIGDYTVVASFEGNPNYTGGAITNVFTVSVNPDYVFKEYSTLEEVEDQIELFKLKYPGREPRVIVFSGSTNDVVSVYWKEQIRNNTALNDFIATNFVCWSDNSAGTPGIGVRDIDDLVRDIVVTGGVLTASQIFEFLRDALVADELPVDASSATLAIAGGTVFAYTGGVHRPDATVKLGSVAIPASCYDLVYSGDGVDAGEYSVHAVFKGAYCGETAAVAYTVAPKAVLPSDISLVPASAVYDGYMHKPSVSTGGIVCTVDYGEGDFTAAGTYAVSVTAAGNHTGTATADFVVHPREVPDAVIVLDAYSAEVKKSKSGVAVDVRPHVLSVHDGSRTYVQGIDYDIEFSSEHFTTAGVYAVTAAFKGNYAGSVSVAFVVTENADQSVGIEGDPDAEIVVDATDPGKVTIRPGVGLKDVVVVVPEGMDASKITVELSTAVDTVKPNGAAIKIVNGGYDITALVDIPEADAYGVVDMAKATVTDDVVGEVLNPAVSDDNVIELDPDCPFLRTVTRPGLVYLLREGFLLDAMCDGDSTVGDGTPWEPSITVKGGTSGFYSIRVQIRENAAE